MRLRSGRMLNPLNLVVTVKPDLDAGMVTVNGQNKPVQVKSDLKQPLILSLGSLYPVTRLRLVNCCRWSYDRQTGRID
ncbi:MAG TPA: hypothetical protein VMJ33_01540 [Gallionella sp.]|nr:hypothetical protein [Gallionella sp.]